MGDKEFSDIFQDDISDSSQTNQEIAFDDEPVNTGRRRINDYKHGSSSIHKGGGQGYVPDYPERKKTSFTINDEKIVWVGAIFVFFGILLFFIGYSLGKVTVKDDMGPKKTILQTIEDTLNQKKTDNSVSLLPQPQSNVTETPVIITPPPLVSPVETQSAETQVTKIYITNSIGMEMPRKEGNVFRNKSLKNVKLKNEEAVSKNENKNESRIILKTSNKSSSGIEGSFTIQVSADTSMDKARTVEDSLRSLGLQTYLVEANVNGTTYYRVRVGRFNDKSDAQTALTKIKGTDNGKESYIVNLN